MKTSDILFLGAGALVVWSMFKSKDVVAEGDSSGYSYSVTPNPEQPPTFPTTTNNTFSIPHVLEETQGGKVVNTMKYNVTNTIAAPGSSLGGSAINSGIGISAPGTGLTTPMSTGFAKLAAKYKLI